MKEFVNFFVSPIGLGHATRDVAIAEKLGSDHTMKFVSGDGAARLLERKGYSCLDLYRPKKFEVKSGELQHAFRWLLDYYSYYRKCKAAAWGVVNENSGLIVSDEDFASIAVGEELNRKRVLITDITETHFTRGAASVLEKQMNKVMKKMVLACDKVIIPDLGEEKDNVVHVGPVVRQPNADRETLRKLFGFERKTMVASTGGTDAGKFLLDKTIESYRRVGGRLDAELVIVTGPSLKVVDSPDYRNLGFVENLHELIYAADLIISLAGRSTIDESMVYGTPGIFIPISGHFEQEAGAARVGFKFEDIFALDRLIEEGLAKSRSPVANANGAEKAARIIASLAS